MGRTQFDGGLIVCGHAHTERSQTVTFGNFTQQCKMGRNRRIRRRYAHQSFHRQLQSATCGNEPVRFARRHPGFLCFFTGVNLHKATPRRAKSVAGDFELAAYWRDTAAAVDVSALTGPLTLTVTNAQGAATTVDVDACS